MRTSLARSLKNSFQTGVLRPASAAGPCDATDTPFWLTCDATDTLPRSCCDATDTPLMDSQDGKQSGTSLSVAFRIAVVYGEAQSNQDTEASLVELS